MLEVAEALTQEEITLDVITNVKVRDSGLQAKHARARIRIHISSVMFLSLCKLPLCSGLTQPFVIP